MMTMVSLLQCFDTFFGLHISHLIFSATERTSRSLQAQDTSVQEALSAAKLAIACIKRQRNDATYQMFYSSVVLQAKKYTDDPVLPCYKRPPRHLDDGSAPHIFTSSQEYFRARYFEALDFVENEISRRFKVHKHYQMQQKHFYLKVPLLPVRKIVECSKSLQVENDIM